MKKITLKVLFILLFINNINLFAQAPANDNPVNAIALTVGDNFSENIVIGDNTNATASEDTDNTIPAPNCAFYNGGDVWYSVEVPENGIINIETNSSNGFSDGGLAVYSGTIGNLSLVECDDDGGVNAFSFIQLANRTANELLYIRVWEFNGNEEGEFEISAWSPEIPINDEPFGAIALTVGENFESEAIIDDNFLATNSEDLDSTIPEPTCGSYAGSDVWYTAQVPENGNVNIEVQAHESSSSISDVVIAVYSGSIGNLTLVDCNSFPNVGNGLSFISVRDANPNDILYVRAWEGGGNLEGSYQISAWSFEAPVNDDPSGATTLTIGEDFESEAIVDDNFLATNSEDIDNTIPNPTCGSYNGGDIWYTVEVPTTGKVNIEINFNNGNSTLFDTDIAVYSGSIGNLTLTDCNSFINNSSSLSFISITEATPGDTLYIRVWAGGGNDEDFFQISAWATPEITPVNDDPSGAIDLTVGTFFSSEVIIDDNVVATASEETDSSIINPECANYNGADVWYTVTIPESGHLNIQTTTNDPSSISDTGLAIYSGTPGNLTLIDCNDNNSSFTTNYSLININGGTSGEVLYVRAWENGGDETGTFQISAWEGTSPGNNNANAFNPKLNVGGNFSANAIVGTNILATNYEDINGDVPSPNCGSYNGSDVWYIVEIPSDGTVIVETQAEEGSTIMSTGLALYSGDTSGFTLEACSDPIDGFAISSLTGRTPGEIIYVRVWETGGDVEDTFQISAWNSALLPENDEPINAIALTVGTDFDSQSIVTNNSFATASEEINISIPAPGCASYNGRDVWFTVDVPSDGSITIETQSYENVNIDLGMAIYSGTDLLNLSLVECDDDDGLTTFSLIALENRTPGETLYIRIWEFGGSNSEREFQISAWNENAVLSTNNNVIEGLNFHPNPVKEILTISAQLEIDDVILYTLNGQEVKPLTISNKNSELNLSNLSQGIYFIKVIADDQTQTLKILKE